MIVLKLLIKLLCMFLFIIVFILGCNGNIKNNEQEVLTMFTIEENTIYDYLRSNLTNNTDNYTLYDAHYLYGMDSKKMYLYYHFELIKQDGSKKHVIEDKEFPIVLQINTKGNINHISPMQSESFNDFVNKHFPKKLQKTIKNSPKNIGHNVTQYNINKNYN